jgi:hypothetical protein
LFALLWQGIICCSGDLNKEKETFLALGIVSVSVMVAIAPLTAAMVEEYGGGRR